MITATILGAGIVGIICVYMFFKLGENTGREHLILQLLILAILIGSVVVIGGASYKASNCDLLLTNETTINNVTSYNYGYVCQDESIGISTTFVKLTQWFYRLIMTYLIIYFIYKVLLSFGVDLPKIFKNRFK